jgi:Tfp pilus assembly protein PilF
MERNGPLPNHPRILYLKGKCLVYCGDDLQGKEYFKRAMAKDPDFKECQISMKNLKKS